MRLFKTFSELTSFNADQLSAVVNIDETEKLLAEMRGEIDNLKAHLEAAARAGSILQQQYLSGEIGNMTSAMAQLETRNQVNCG